MTKTLTVNEAPNVNIPSLCLFLMCDHSLSMLTLAVLVTSIKYLINTSIIIFSRKAITQKTREEDQREDQKKHYPRKDFLVNFQDVCQRLT